MKLAVEYAGTLFFLSVIISTGNWAAIGAALALVAFLGGGISGGHYNPAVTFMFYIKDAIPLRDALAYVVVQLLGGATAYFLYNTLVTKPVNVKQAQSNVKEAAKAKSKANAANLLGMLESTQPTNASFAFGNGFNIPSNVCVLGRALYSSSESQTG